MVVDSRYFSGGWGDYTDIPLGTIFICPISPCVPPQKKNQISYIKYAKIHHIMLHLQGIRKWRVNYTSIPLILLKESQ